jgi:Protein of unknown function (DUF3300)
MSFQVTKQVISTLMCVILVPLTVPAEAAGFYDQTPPQTSSTSAPTVAPLTSDQLDALVAPIALYPDALVAQVLAAAIYPEQVAFADDWLSQNMNLSGSALAQAVNQESWDPSVKALTQFPTVLHDLAKNLSWTSNLGQAFGNQQSDVMAAVQAMRAQAQAAGTLTSTPQIKVVQQSPQTIVIQPANPRVVYVPQYNPAVVYGSPYVVPLYTPPVAVAAATVSFGTGVAIGAAFGGGAFVGGAIGGVSWGFSSWGCNWGGGGGGGGNVIYNHNTYVNKTTVNRSSTYNNYHPWNKNGQDTATNRPNFPNGSHERTPTNTPNGGDNGNHGLIGGNGGVQHNPQQRIGNDQRPGNDLHAANDARAGNDPRFGQNQQRNAAGADRQRGNAPGAARQRAFMSGDGNRARAEANRGRASMNRGGGVQRAEARGGGGARGRR